jgi:hypothetical protein
VRMDLRWGGVDVNRMQALAPGVGQPATRHHVSKGVWKW